MHVYATPTIGSELEAKKDSLRKERPTLSELKVIYAGIDIDLDVLYDPIADQDEFENRFLASKLWRMNNLYVVVNKDGERVTFVMKHAQHIVYAAIMKWYRLLILKSRQQGISTFWLVCFHDDTVFYQDVNAGLMAQGKNEAGKLLKRAKLVWRSLDPNIKRFLERLSVVIDNKDEIGLSNNSSLYIQVSFRSDTLHRLHVSELGKIANNNPERVRELRTGTLQAIKPGNPVVIESTADGDNDFRVMWDKACSHKVLGPKDFKPIFLSWLDDPDCVSYTEEYIDPLREVYFAKLEKELGITLRPEQKNFWINTYRELDEDIYQEYPATPEEAFLKVRDGTYYARLYNKFVISCDREVDGLYDPNLSVQVALDLGVNDTFVVVFFQRYRDEWRIVDEYHNSGEDLEHYVTEIFSRGYTISAAEVPHDGRVRELQTITKREHTLRRLGLTNLNIVELGSRETGIEQVRQAIKNLWIDKRCTYIIKCLKEYTKEYNDKYDVWHDRPKHDEASNGADAVRVMVMGRRLESSRIGVETFAGRHNRDSLVDGLSL